MEHSNRWLATGFAGLLVLGSTLVASAETWDLSTEFNERYIFGKGYIAFAEEVKKRTNGEIDIVPQFGGALGYKSADHLELVGQGALVLADTYSGAISGVDPLFQLSSLPFVVSSVDDAWELYQLAKPYYQDFFKKHGQVLLYSSFHPASGLWAKKPLTSTGDMQGLRIRTYDAAGDEAMRNIGAAPIQMNITEVVGQLASGGLEGVLTSAEGASSMKFWEFLNNFTEINYAIPLQFMHMNKSVFDGLSPQNQKVLLDVSAEIEKMNWDAGRNGTQETYDLMRENGVSIVTNAPKEFLDALAAAGQPVVEKWLTEVGENGTQVLNAFREKKKAQ